MIDARGKHKKELRKKNRKRIEAWLEKNPEKSRADCCKDLSITFGTLQSHLKDIEAEP